MKKIDISTQVTQVDFDTELTEQEKQVMIAARKAVDTAYAPYSNYNVGAAVLLENGEIVPGNNQENAVFPLGLCAERVALFSAGTSFPNSRPIVLAVTIASDNKPGFPCGSCRQAMVEFENRFDHKMKLLIDSKDGQVITIDTVRDILPFSFDQSNLD